MHTCSEDKFFPSITPKKPAGFFTSKKKVAKYIMPRKFSNSRWSLKILKKRTFLRIFQPHFELHFFKNSTFLTFPKTEGSPFIDSNRYFSYSWGKICETNEASEEPFASDQDRINPSIWSSIVAVAAENLRGVPAKILYSPSVAFGTENLLCRSFERRKNACLRPNVTHLNSSIRLRRNRR